MHFSARSALLASCLAISVQALPVTYSVVDVDGGSAANGAPGSTDQLATVYQTVTKSAEVEEPEATTVSVSITVVETEHASASASETSTDVSSFSSSLSSSFSSSVASAQASSSASSPAATSTTSQDALSVLQSAKSTFQTRPTSIVSTPSANPTITQAPSTAAASQASQTDSESECEASSVTVTAEVTDEETVTATHVSTKGNTVVLFSTTTVTPAAASTSYYDDGMWHTRYAIKPSASPEAASPAAKHDDAAPDFEAASRPDGDKPAHANGSVAANTSSQPANATYHARREVDTVAPTPTVHAVPGGSSGEGSGAPLMLVQPLLPAVTNAAAPDPAAVPGVLSANDDIVTEHVAKRSATYNVVSWNETTEG
jgi:hypothetical protein